MKAQFKKKYVSFYLDIRYKFGDCVENKTIEDLGSKYGCVPGWLSDRIIQFSSKSYYKIYITGSFFSHFRKVGY